MAQIDIDILPEVDLLKIKCTFAIDVCSYITGFTHPFELYNRLINKISYRGLVKFTCATFGLFFVYEFVSRRNLRSWFYRLFWPTVAKRTIPPWLYRLCWSKRPKGIPNLGNTCYMNSILQVLCWTPHLGHQLQEQLKQNETTRKETLGKSFLKLMHKLPIVGSMFQQKSMTEALFDLIYEVHGENGEKTVTVSRYFPNMILHRARKVNSQFNGHNPQDSFEMYNTIIPAIEDEHLSIQHLRPEDENDETQKLTNVGPVSQLFEGEFITVYCYDSCEHIEHVEQKFTSICVPVVVQTKGFQDSVKESNNKNENFKQMSLGSTLNETNLSGLEEGMDSYRNGVESHDLKEEQELISGNSSNINEHASTPEYTNLSTGSSLENEDLRLNSSLSDNDQIENRNVSQNQTTHLTSYMSGHDNLAFEHTENTDDHSENELNQNDFHLSDSDYDQNLKLETKLQAFDWKLEGPNSVRYRPNKVVPNTEDLSLDSFQERIVPVNSTRNKDVTFANSFSQKISTGNTIPGVNSDDMDSIDVDGESTFKTVNKQNYTKSEKRKTKDVNTWNDLANCNVKNVNKTERGEIGDSPDEELVADNPFTEEEFEKSEFSEEYVNIFPSNSGHEGEDSKSLTVVQQKAFLPTGSKVKEGNGLPDVSSEFKVEQENNLAMSSLERNNFSDSDRLITNNHVPQADDKELADTTPQHILYENEDAKEVVLTEQLLKSDDENVPTGSIFMQKNILPSQSSVGVLYSSSDVNDGDRRQPNYELHSQDLCTDEHEETMGNAVCENLNTNQNGGSLETISDKSLSDEADISTPAFLEEHSEQYANDQISKNTSLDYVEETYEPDPSTAKDTNDFNKRDDLDTNISNGKEKLSKEDHTNEPANNSDITHNSKNPTERAFETLKESREPNYTDLEKGLIEVTTIEYFSEEVLGCRYCAKEGKPDGKGQVHKKLMVKSPSPVLALQINRFRQTANKLEKIQGQLTFPKMLDLSAYCSRAIVLEEPTDEVLYHLYGVVAHNGTIENGHYYSYIRTNKASSSELHYHRFLKPKVERENESVTITEFLQGKMIEKQAKRQSAEDDKWYYVTDTLVIETTEGRVLNDANACLLMYERIN